MHLLMLLLFVPGCDRLNKTSANPVTAVTAIPAAPAPLPKITSAELNHYLNLVKGYSDSMFKKYRLNGSLLVAKHGEIIYEEYQGYTNPRLKKDSISFNTPFHLASISKTFTGMGILKLWQDAKLNIDDSVSHYLEGFPCQGVTVRMLLDHRSGIPKYDHYMERLGWNKHKMVSNQDVLDFLIARHKDIQIGKPNRAFSYSNTNFALLALIIEKVSGMPYADFMRTTFFEPLGMKDSFVFTKADSSRYMPSYHTNGRAYAFDFLDWVYGDKNVYSTVRDLMKWDQALHGDSLFTKQTLDAAYTPYSFEKPGVHNYGLAWRMYCLKNGKKLIYHNGWWHGNRTAFYRLIDEDVTIIALCNNDCKKVYTVKEIADFFGDYMQRTIPEEEMNSSVTHAAHPHHRKAKHPAKNNLAYKKKTPSRSLAAKK